MQETFARIKEIQREQKELKTIYRDTLKNIQEYGEVVDQIATLRERKKQIEESTKEQFKSELKKLDNLKIDLETEQELLSDMALNQLIKGETVSVKDESENEYEPIFSVKFKKS